MSQHPDHQQFDEITADKVDPSNVIPIRADIAQAQKPAAGRKPKGKCYLAPTAKLDFLLAKDIDPDLTPMARRVLTLIMAHRNKDTGEAFPGEDTMARILGVKRLATISDAVKELVGAGWIKKVRKRNRSRTGSIYGSNHYTLLMDKVEAVLTNAGISFTKGLSSTPDQDTVLREGNLRFCVSEDAGKPYENPPSEPVEMNPSKEKVSNTQKRGLRYRCAPGFRGGNG